MTYIIGSAGAAVPSAPVSRETMERARRLAAAVFAADTRSDLAEIALRGGGDDFPEVRVAASILDRLGDQLSRYEEALRIYADPGFWDEEALPGGPLALHDKGEVAKNVLAGKRPFFHRD